MGETQIRMGPTRPMGFDYPALWQIADVLGIEITPGLIRRIKTIETFICTQKGGD